MKHTLLFLFLFICSAVPMAAQQTVYNGSESFTPGSWVGIQVPNAASTGTTVNKVAKLTGTGTAVISATTDTSGLLGIVSQGAGTTGNATVVQIGQVSCVFDGATTADDYVINSTTTTGDCKDAGATPPSSEVLGRVLTTNGGAGTYVILVGPNGAGTIPVGSGTATFGTGAISSGSCTSVVTVSATGVLTTDRIISTPNADWTAITGYSGVGTTLSIYPYPTANNVNWKVCNWTGSSITPTAVTINWAVVR